MSFLSISSRLQGVNSMEGKTNTAASLRRIRALVRKEFCQLGKSTSSFLMGIVLPAILILIIGYGISLDVKNINVAVVLEDHAPTARNAVSFLRGSAYFEPVYLNSFSEAENLLRKHEADAIVCVPVDFSARLAEGDASLQLILNGEEAVTAMSVQRYVEAGLQAAMAQNGGVRLASRVWYNDADTSTWFFVPGIMMLVLTISGVFLTAVVMAREWEQGTFEAIFVTPARIIELIIAEVIPYFCIAVLGMLLCLLAGRFLYDLPFRGSLGLIIGESLLYLVVALSLGIFISALTKSQFLACQVSLVVSFLPTVMLSGFLFDLHAQPVFIQYVSLLFPTTYYLQVMKTLFLVGNYWPVVVKNTVILLGYALLLIGLAWHKTKKKLEG